MKADDKKQTENVAPRPPHKGPPKVSGLLSLGKLPVTTDQTAVNRLPSFEQTRIPDNLETEGNNAKSIKLPLSKLRPSPYNSRKHRSTERINELASSLQEHGQREAVTVYRGVGEDSGYLMVLSGETRRLAAVSIGWSELDGTIDDSIDASNPLDIVRASHVHNDTEKETDLDFVSVSQSLTTLGYSKTEIALALGIGRRDAYRLAAFEKLPAKVLICGQQNPTKFTGSVAELCLKQLKILGEEAVLDVLSESISTGFTVSELETKFRAAGRIDHRSQRRTRISKVDFKLNGHRVGSLTVMKSVVEGEKTVKFESSVGEDMADRLADRIEEVLKEFSASGS